MKLVPSPALYLQDLVWSYGLQAVLTAIRRLPGHHSVYITRNGRLCFLDGRATIEAPPETVDKIIDYLVRTEFALDAVTIHHVYLAQSNS